jgi:hypothetical protein
MTPSLGPNPRRHRGGDAPKFRHTSAVRRDDGSTLLLLIFSTALALALVLSVAAATSLYLERKRLFTLADGAALAASESFALSTITRDGGGGITRARLTDEGVTQAALQYLARVSPGRLDALTLHRSVTEDGRSATIGLTSDWRPPVVTLFFPEGIRLVVESTARSIFFN